MNFTTLTIVIFTAILAIGLVSKGLHNAPVCGYDVRVTLFSAGVVNISYNRLYHFTQFRGP